MNTDSQQILDSIFLSYNKILIKLHNLGLTTKHGKEISHMDLRKAIDVMLKKHPTCRWRSEKIKSKRYYILFEGYLWLIYVYFQSEKNQIDADIIFFETRIKEYEKLLEINLFESREANLYVLTEKDKKQVGNLTKDNDIYEKLFNIIEELSSDTNKLEKVRDSLDSYIDRINIASSYENEKFYKIRIFRCN